MARQSKEVSLGSWRYATGRKPHTVVAFERKDKGCTVWLRWTRAGTGLYDKQALGFSIRDKAGRIDPELRKKAEDAADKAYDRLLRGEDPRTPEVPKDAGGAEKLTIAAGLERALAVPGGMYAVENAHVLDMRRYKTQVLAAMPTLRSMTWDQITAVTYEHAWQALAGWRARVGERDHRGEITGKRAAHLAVVLLAQAGRWLKRARLVPTTPDEPDPKWETKFYADWARITKDRHVEHEQPRHTEEELGLLWLAIDRRLGDPRFRTMFLTASENRMGQAIRCDRNLLDLSNEGKFGCGRFVIPDTDKKKGATIDLTPAMRAEWDYALTQGYLRDLEKMYRNGLIRTYPLCPGRRLRNGVARTDWLEAIGDRGALDLFHELERMAGVTPQFGRGWYGVRRISTDLAEDLEKDSRVLNAITGHTSDKTRTKYQKRKRDTVLGRATEVRVEAREHAVAAALAAGLALPEAAPGTSEGPRVAKPRGPRKKPTYPPRPCPTCGAEFAPTGPHTKQCEKCSPRRIRPAKGAAAPTPDPTPA